MFSKIRGLSLELYAVKNAQGRQKNKTVVYNQIVVVFEVSATIASIAKISIVQSHIMYIY